MLNLEKLTLYLRFDRHSILIDPVSILNKFAISNTKLESFNFYISTENDPNDLQHHLSTNCTEQNHLYSNQSKVSNVACLGPDRSVYHFFTVPFEFLKLSDVSNSFPNMVFKNVVDLCACDVIPFEHDFFLRISHNFPSLKPFSVAHYPYMLENQKKSSNDQQSCQIATLNHVEHLNIKNLDVETIELLLNETKAHLPRLRVLRIE